MLEILPIKFLRDEDALIFGSLNVALGKLARAGLPVASGIAVSPPDLHLKTVMDHYDFGKREIFEQSLTLVKKEIEKTPIPAELEKEVKKHVKKIWLTLLFAWLEQIKERLWKDGFYPGITEGLDPRLVIFEKKVQASGSAYFDTLQDDVVINIKKGKLHPKDLKKITEMVSLANK
ncbi:hypothetical protein HYU96_04870, partial [Candidatus Daviesbacteria bacterium]|nr:hypothetical protein [Candidatus Daviesbacteria bacterium]